MDDAAWQRRMLVAPILSADMRTAAEPLNSFIERVSGGALLAPRHLAPLVALLERARHEPVRAVVSAPPQHWPSVGPRAMAWSCVAVLRSARGSCAVSPASAASLSATHAS